MSRRTIALIALGVLAVFLFVNRSSLTLQHIIVPAAAVGIAIWLAIRWKVWRWLFSTAVTRPDRRTSSHVHPLETVSQAPPAKLISVSPGTLAWSPTVYTVRVPRDTPWKPEFAVALIREFVPIGSLALRIATSGHEIQWQVLDLDSTPVAAGLIAQAVRKVYPDAEVTAGAYEPPPFDGPFYRVVESYGQLQDFVGPIKYPKDFAHSDPLAVVANLMNNLEQGERVVYTIFLGNSSDRYYRDALKQTKGSNWSFQNVLYITLGFFTIIGAVVSVLVIFYKLFFEKRPDKYRESDMNVIYGKLNDLPLVGCYVMVEVNSPDEERLSHFDVQPALLHYAHEFQKLGRSSAKPKIVRVVSEYQDWSTSSLAELMHRKDRSYASRSGPPQCILSPSEVASLWHLPHEEFQASNIAWTKGKHVPLPTIMRGKSEGVYLGNNLYGGRCYPVYMLPKDRAGHMIVVGKTGMGKSTLLHNLIRQDIAAGRGVALIDPSPKDKNIVPRILQQSIPDARRQDVVVLDLSDRQTPPPFNLFSVPANVPRRDTVSSIRAIFERVYGSSFSEARMGRTFGMALHTVLADPTPTVRDIARVAWNADYREQLLERVTSEGALDFWERFALMPPGEQEAYFEPILGRIEALYDNELLYPVVCHPDPLDLGTYIQQGKIVLISLCPPENVGLAPSEQALLETV